MTYISIVGYNISDLILNKKTNEIEEDDIYVVDGKKYKALTMIIAKLLGVKVKYD